MRWCWYCDDTSHFAGICIRLKVNHAAKPQALSLQDFVLKYYGTPALPALCFA